MGVLPLQAVWDSREREGQLLARAHGAAPVNNAARGTKASQAVLSLQSSVAVPFVVRGIPLLQNPSQHAQASHAPL